MSAAGERRPSQADPAAALAPAIVCELENFLYDEAACLDAGRFEQWAELFDDDGFYWVPGQFGQETPESALSIFCENKSLLLLRARRLAHPQTHLQVPAARTHHHLNSLRVRAVEPGEFAVDCLLMLVEWREGEQRVFSGRCRYRIRRTGAGLKIASKRVDLLNCDAPHRAIAVPF